MKVKLNQQVMKRGRIKMVKISATLARQLLKKKDHKYGAKRTKCLYGHDHDSKKEAMYCIKLHQLQREGKIRNLSREPIYDLRVNGTVVATHSPDFDYVRLVGASWRVEVVDVKGMKLPMWRLKHKIFCALYPDIDYKVV